MRLRALPLRPSSAARLGSEWRAQNPLPRIAGAAHERPAFVFARHLPFAAACRLTGMGETPSITEPLLNFQFPPLSWGRNERSKAPLCVAWPCRAYRLTLWLCTAPGLALDA